MNMVVTTSAPPRCDAHASGRAVTDWGLEFLPCQTVVGLRSFTDQRGDQRHFCAAEGHEANAKRRFGVQSDEVRRVASVIEAATRELDGTIDEGGRQRVSDSFADLIIECSESHAPLCSCRLSGVVTMPDESTGATVR